jgi:hypothetical protein
LLAAIGLVLAACGGSDSEDEVRPFSDVQASEFVFENDSTAPDRGIFRVTTTEPMICAIVWGETEALGNQNNSLAMNGTGIIDHDVLLPGAEAGGTYFYRVQGSTADGTLFQSEIASFTLPEVEEAAGGDTSLPAVGENLALGATISDVSSEFSDAWVGGNAVDGDLATEWASADDGSDAFITIDLGEATEVAGVEYVTRSMADGSAITTSYSIVVDDGDRLGPFPAGNLAQPSYSEASFTGRVLRFEVEDTTGGNTGAVEIRVYGPPK